MLEKSNNTYKYYKSIDFLPIYHFFKVIESNDKRYILKLEDYSELPEIENLEFLENAWTGIESQYNESEDSNGAVIQFVTAKGIHKLELEYFMLLNIYNLMIIEGNGNNSKECLKKAGLEDKNIEWIKKRLNALTNKINLKRKDVKEDIVESKKFDFWQRLDSINDAKGYKISPFKTTVREYIAIKKNIKKNDERQDRIKRHS